MKVILLTIVIAAVSLALNWLFPGLPWFTTFIIAFIGGIFARAIKTKSFLAGFLGVGIFWAILIMSSHFRNHGIMSENIAGVFSENMGRNIAPLILLIITPLLGGLIGGLSALSGKLFTIPYTSAQRQVRRKDRRKGSYKLKLN